MLKSVEEINNELKRNKHGYVVDDTHHTMVNGNDFEVVGAMLDLDDDEIHDKLFMSKHVPMAILSNKKIMDSLKSIIKSHNTVGVSVLLSYGAPGEFYGSELVLSEAVDPPKPVMLNGAHKLVGRQYVYKLANTFSGDMLVCEQFFNMYEK